MSRVKDPGSKKRLSLEKDHRVSALEGNKTFRKAWRLKKAKAARKLRRAQARDIRRVQEERESTTAKPKRTLIKFGVMSLSQSIVLKGSESGDRWDFAMLGRNKEARKAAVRRRKKTK